MNTTIYRNTIKNNTIGIKLEHESDGNLIYLNNFTENELHAQDDCLYNRWDYQFNGNYWDNHTGPDNDKDCIVDIPYTWITGSAGSQDNFPLMPCWPPSPPSGSAGGGGGGDGNDDDEGTELDVLTITLLSVGIASAIVIAVVAIILIRKRKGIENR